MTREQIKNAIDPGGDSGSLVDVIGPKWCEELVSRLAAALEAERVGEVVLGEGPVQQLNGNPCVGGIPVVRAVNKYLGKKGSLIFREDK